MSHPPIVNVVRAERCIADLGDGLQLVVSDELGGSMHASIFRGQWPRGEQLVGIVFELRQAHVATADDIDGLWLGRTKVTLPWIELLKVADYLQLPIDVPESGEQVQS